MAELAHGQRYQKAYQDYEAQRIREAVSLDDPHFYDPFFEEHGQIASPVGRADTFVVQRDERLRFNIPCVVFCAGAFALLGACIGRLRRTG